MQVPGPLSARILQQADALHVLAHQVAALDARLGSQVILAAVQVGLLQPAALAQERDLARARHIIRQVADDQAAARKAAPHRVPAPCPTATALADMRQRHARARIIADILGPMLAPDAPARSTTLKDPT